jgi:hypothetical protein
MQRNRRLGTGGTAGRLTRSRPSVRRGERLSAATRRQPAQVRPGECNLALGIPVTTRAREQEDAAAMAGMRAAELIRVIGEVSAGEAIASVARL